MAAKTRSWTLAAALVAGTATVAGAAGNGTSLAGTAATGTADASPAAKEDLAFVREAAIGGMTEVELGKLAQRRGASDQVKQFGAKMVEDHTQANNELKQIASQKQIDMPMALDAKHQRDVARFGKLGGDAFDRAYLKDMVADHRKDVADFRKAAASAHDADVKAFAGKTLPTLEQHLQMAEAAAGKQ